MPPETQELFLQEQQFQDADCIMVAEFLIQNLMIGATALAQALRSNRVLTSLSLKDNQVGPEGAEKLAAMLHDNRTIERLNLMGCAVGDQGVEALAGALALPSCNLLLLALRHNSALAENPPLTELALNSNLITDVGIAALAVALTTNTRLEILRLTENDLGRESLKRLTNSRRPGLHIYF
ncbi:hypothetical protein T484DRAFT_1770354 [Baffinella frigidus]|nr:hypothetical protein T484DRAFT_1770354 [Cryptophyta sp. CCMP2293]